MEPRQSKSPKKPVRSQIASRRSSHFVQKSDRSSFIQPWEIEDNSYDEDISRRGTTIQITNKNDKTEKEKEDTSPSLVASQRNMPQDTVSNMKEFPTKNEMETVQNKVKKVARAVDEAARDQQLQKSRFGTNNASNDRDYSPPKKKKEDSHISHKRNTSKSTSKNTKSTEYLGLDRSAEKHPVESDSYLLSGLKHYLSEKRIPFEVPLGITKFPILPNNDPASLDVPRFKVGLSSKLPFQRYNDDSQMKKEFSSNNVSTRIRAIDNTLNIAFPQNENRESRRFQSVQKSSAQAITQHLNETPEIQRLLRGNSNYADSKMDLSGHKNNEINTLRHPIREASSINFLYDLEDRKRSIKETVNPAIFDDSTRLSSSPLKYDLLVGLISPLPVEQTNREKSESKDNHFLMRLKEKKESPEWIKSFKPPSKGSYTLTYRRGKRMRKVLEVKDATNSRSISQAHEQQSLPGIESPKKVNVQNFFEKAIRDRERQNNGISWETDSKVIKEVAMGPRLKETPLLKLLQKQIENHDKDDVIAPKKLISLASSPKATIPLEKHGRTPRDNVLVKPFSLKEIYTSEHGLVAKKAKPLFHLAQSPSTLKTVKSELNLKRTQVKKGAAIF